VDPRFADEAARNLDFPSDSPLYLAVPGFQPLPFSSIGLKLDEYRTALPEGVRNAHSPDSKAMPSFDSNIDIKASDHQDSAHP
jgi:hypothetical protein